MGATGRADPESPDARSTGEGRILYRSASSCPRCGAGVPARPASLAVHGSSVLLCRTCPEHGEERLPVSDDAPMFEARLARYFRRGMQGRDADRPGSLTLHLTDRCDLACPICFTAGGNRPDAPDPDIDSLEAAVRATATERVALFGGEPLVREDLDDVVRRVRALGREPILYTNGVRLARPGRAGRLAAAGLREAHLQFDGFDRDLGRRLRGADLTDGRVAAIEACRAAGIAVVLEVTCSPETSPDEMRRILDFAVARPGIGGVVFRGLGRAGRAAARADRVFVEDVARRFEEATGGRATRAGIEAFDALVLAAQDFLGWPRATCLKNRVYPLLRTGGGYATAEELLPLDGLARLVEPDGLSWRRLPAMALLGLPAVRDRRLLGLAGGILRLLASRHAGARNIRYPSDGGLLLVGIAGMCEAGSQDAVVARTCPSALFVGGRIVPFVSEGYPERTRGCIT